MNHPATHLSPLLGVGTTDNDDIDWHAEIPKGAMKPNRLLRLIDNFRLDDKEVQVALGTSAPGRLRAEQDHLRARRSRT